MLALLKVWTSILLISGLSEAPWAEQVQIRGNGYFGVRLPSDEMAYTRNLYITVDSQGSLVTEDGYLISPSVQTIKGNIWRSIRYNGEVVSADPSSHQPTTEGRLMLFRFKNPSALKPIGAGLYQATEESGVPTSASADEGGAGWIKVIP